MSNLAERPWNEEEKYTLLTEILKEARVPSSHLVKMIRDFGITPSWTDIPLPQGRSLNSCQMAFYNMCQHVPLSVNPGRGPVPPHAHESAPPATAPLDPSALRKRPLFPLDKGIRAPRAIQPRPATSTASYSSESGASALLSPSSESITVRGEPPRKRGRPSKAESERRKAAAEARGETYPPPRRSGSIKGKLPSSPTSPAGLGPGAPLFGPQVVGRPLNSSQSELHYPAPPRRPLSMGGAIGEARLQEIPSQELVPSMRELPRPPEMKQTLPSPQALQLGHRESISRRGTGDRSFEPLLPDRTSFVESNRRNLIHPLARRPEEAHGTAPELLIERPAETRSE